MHAGRALLGLALLLVCGIGLRATTVVQPSFASLVDSADYVVRGKVTAITSEWRENPSRPGERYIGSSITLQVLEIIKGAPMSPLVLEVVGGRVGEQEMRIEGAPQFSVGGEYILFVEGNHQNFFPLVGLMHGYFSVRRDAKTGRGEVLRHNGQPLTSEAELTPGARVRASSTGMTPEAFRDRIQLQDRTNHSSRDALR